MFSLKVFLKGYFEKFEYLLLIPLYVIISTIVLVPIVWLIPIIDDFYYALLAVLIGFEVAAYPIHQHIVDTCNEEDSKSKLWIHCLGYSSPLLILLIGFLILYPDPTFIYNECFVITITLFGVIKLGKKCLETIKQRRSKMDKSPSKKFE